MSKYPRMCSPHLATCTIHLNNIIYGDVTEKGFSTHTDIRPLLCSGGCERKQMLGREDGGKRGGGERTFTRCTGSKENVILCELLKEYL